MISSYVINGRRRRCISPRGGAISTQALYIMFVNRGTSVATEQSNAWTGILCWEWEMEGGRVITVGGFVYRAQVVRHKACILQYVSVGMVGI